MPQKQTPKKKVKTPSPSTRKSPRTSPSPRKSPTAIPTPRTRCAYFKRGCKCSRCTRFRRKIDEIVAEEMLVRPDLPKLGRSMSAGNGRYFMTAYPKVLQSAARRVKHLNY